jgi:16S rRNA (guanine527-N7)-methyltransferase
MKRDHAISDQQARIDRFRKLVLDRNRKVNVTAARDEQSLAAHVEDSIAIAPFIVSPYVDVGSGGGFPAIPIAVVTGAQTTMIESVAKKARFLREAADELELDALVLCERAEDAARDPQHRERYASATARAVGSATTVLELTVPLLAPGGLAVLQRGEAAEGEARAVADACLVLGAQVERVVAQDGARRLLLVRKIAPTGDRFPRRAGMPSKRPLCR